MQLKRVIQRDIISRDLARCNEDFLEKRHLEELLIPFGRTLAWSFVLDNHKSDAVSLLRLIEGALPSFGWSPKILSQVPIQPV